MARSKKPLLSLETQKLRLALKAAFETPYLDSGKNVGAFTCGVYAFFDYDNEPIYVGQTFEGLSSRIWQAFDQSAHGCRCNVGSRPF